MERHPALVAARAPLYAALLDRLEELQPPGRLLDLGCGTGAFLAAARRRGWDAKGLEPDPAAAGQARARGFDVQPEAGALAPGSFDAVCAWEVLDLSADPRALLKTSAGLLKDGGVLWLRVRNAPFQRACAGILRALGTRWLARLPVLHRHGFSRRTLTRLLRQEGFTDVRRPPCGLAGVEFYSRGLGPAAALALRLARSFCRPSLLVRARKPCAAPRVLHLITRLDPGGSSEAARLAASQAGALLAAGPGAARAPDALAVPHLARRPDALQDLRAFWEICALLGRVEPDVLHTHCSKAGALGRWAAWLLNWTTRRARPMRVVHTPHGHVLYGYFGPLRSAAIGAVERLSALVTDRLVAVSEGERRESLAYGIGTAQQWRVIPNALAPSAGAGVSRADARLTINGFWPLSEQTLLVGTAARLEPVKGLSDFLESAALLARARPERDVRFLILGDGSLRAELAARAQALGLGPRLLMPGHVSPPERLMAGLDVYVQPSLNEAMGLGALRAQRLGLPVAASAVCGLPDLIEHERTGLLVAPGDAPALAQAVLRLLDEPALRAALGEAGRRAAQARGAPEAMLEGLARLYAGAAR